MIKTFIQFLLLRLIPAWILAFLLMSVSSSWFQNWHGFIATRVAVFLAKSELPAQKFRLISDEIVPAPEVVQWPNGAELELHQYKNRFNSADYLNDLPISRQKIISIGSLLTTNQAILESSNDAGIWNRSIFGYKQIVYRNGTFTFLDQVLQRDFESAYTTIDSAHAGYLSVPTDLFGGLFLFSSLAPEPLEVLSNDTDVISVSEKNSATKQFLAELWAIDNQQWVYSHWIMVLLASLMTCLPWFILSLPRRKWISILTISILNLSFFIVFFIRVQWFYPLILPFLSVIVAWFWQLKISRKQSIIDDLERRQVSMTDLWIGHLLDEGKPEAALRHLQEVNAFQNSYVGIWQKVANGFERNRQFARSIECYQAMLTCDSKLSEARQKIKKLKSIVDGTKTMAIAQSNGELPVGQIDNLSLGRYQIARELGRGAMGIVYEAEDPKIHRKVALKVVHLKNLGVDEMEGVKLRFFREAQAAGKLNHPNIVTVYDVGEEHDVAYIAMDLLIGRPLSAHLTERPIELIKVVRWIAQAAEALGYAHENDIIHRDVKPANMIIESKLSRLKLTDFGVARIAGVQQTQTGIVLGSPSYMSPEQIRGETLTGSTDIFSLGVTLYQCITGELPFVGDTLPALAYSITQSKQESPRNLNPEVTVSLVRIVNKALQKDPRDRFETAMDFANSLNKWVNDNS